MATTVILSNDPSDVSGFKLAYIGTRGPNASTTASTAVTTTTAGAGTAGMTLTAGGSAAKWITRPLSAAVTVAGTIGINYWALESAANTLVSIDFQLFQFTGSAQVGNAFATTTINAQLRLTADRTFVTIKPTSTAFAVGDRIVILPNCNSAGVELGSQTSTMDYNQSTENSDGDTYVYFTENIQTTTAQGAMAGNSPSLGELEDLRYGIASLSGFAGQMYSADAKISSVLNEVAAQRDLRGA